MSTVLRALGVCMLLAALGIQPIRETSAQAPPSPITCAPLMTVHPDGRVELRCPETATPVPATATTMPTNTATSTSTSVPSTATTAPPTPTQQASGGVIHGVFDDANALDVASFTDMVNRLQALGINAAMLTNGDSNKLDALLAVADQKGFWVYAAPAVELNARWWGMPASYWTIPNAQALAADVMPRLMAHPSLKGWNLVDEPSPDLEVAAAILSWAFQDRDPSRPHFIVSTGLDDRTKVYESDRMRPFVADVYPFQVGDPACHVQDVFGIQGVDVTQYIREIQARSGKPAGVPLWIIGQTHGSAGFGLRAPSREEIRAQYRLARAEGATGMFWFVWTSQQGWIGLKDNPDLLDEVGKIARGQQTGPSCDAVVVPPTATSTPAPPTATPVPQPQGAGVPHVLAAWGGNVETWWNSHPLNPRAGGGIPIGEIARPNPVIDVKNSHGGNIQSAINACPTAGCTLYFWNGTYRNDWQIIGRSNIHFKGESRDGVILLGDATIPIGGVVKGCSDFPDYTSFDQAIEQNSDAAYACGNTRSRNFSFTDVTFDGANGPVQAVESDHRWVGSYGIFYRTVFDLVCDRCVFRNYRDPASNHHGNMSGNVLLDNIWCRGCDFQGSQRYGWFADGCHGCGVVDTTFAAAYGSGTALVLTNNDFSQDWDRSGGDWSLNERRQGQFIVFDHNTVSPSGAEVLNVMGRNVLFSNNTINGSVSWLLRVGRIFGPRVNTFDAGGYQYWGFVVRDNTVNGNLQAAVHYDQEYATPAETALFGGHVITGNHVTGSVAAWVTTVYPGNPFGSRPEYPNVVSGNTP